MADPTLPRRDFYVYGLFRETALIFYVGKGCGRRKISSATVGGSGRNIMKARAIRKTLRILREIPVIIIGDRLTEEEAYALEIELIAAIGRYPNGPLLNMSDGGEGFSDPTGTTADKIRRSLTGFKHTPEARENMRLSKVGHPVSEATRAKLRATWAARLKKVKPPNPQREPRPKREMTPKQAVALQAALAARRGTPITEEERENHRRASTGRKHSEETKMKIRHIRTGTTLSPETKAKIGAASLGHRLSPESKEKVRRGRLGWKPTEETLRRMSEGQKRRYSSISNKNTFLEK